jgi:hypothetical protein
VVARLTEHNNAQLATQDGRYPKLEAHANGAHPESTKAKTRAQQLFANLAIKDSSLAKRTQPNAWTVRTEKCNTGAKPCPTVAHFAKLDMSLCQLLIPVLNVPTASINI